MSLATLTWDTVRYSFYRLLKSRRLQRKIKKGKRKIKIKGERKNKNVIPFRKKQKLSVITEKKKRNFSM